MVQLTSSCVLFVCQSPDIAYFLKSKTVKSASLVKIDFPFGNIKLAQACVHYLKRNNDTRVTLCK